MDEYKLTLLLMVISLKKELLDMAVTVKNENESTYPRDEMFKDLIEMVNSCSELEQVFITT